MALYRSVLFVCLGNICRSPLAEGAMAEVASRRGLDLRVDSAGTGSWNLGEPPDRRAIATARRHGVAISAHRARQVRTEDFFRFDLILALDHENFTDLGRIRPAQAHARLNMLLDHLPGHEGQPVPDPYYGEMRDFELVWDLVQAAAGALADELEQNP